MTENESSFSPANQSSTVVVCNQFGDVGKYVHTAAYCLVFVLALAGNILVMLSVRNNKRLWTSSNYLIVNMSCSDILLPVIASPRMIVEVLMGRETWLLHGTLGLISCKLVYFLQDVSTAVSVQSLVVITVERFCAVTFPLRAATMIQPKVKFIIPVTWAIAFSLHSVYFHTFQLCEAATGQGRLLCCQKWPSNRSQAIYFFTILILVFAIPLLLMIVMYSLIVVRLRRRKFPEDHSASRRRREARKERQNRNVLKMAVAIVVAFFLCFGPVVIFALIRSTRAVHFEKCVEEIYRSIAKFLAQSNCAVNPIICFFFNSHFRKEFKRYLAMVFCCKTQERRTRFRNRRDTYSLRRLAPRNSSVLNSTPRSSLMRPAEQNNGHAPAIQPANAQPLLQEPLNVKGAQDVESQRKISRHSSI